MEMLAEPLKTARNFCVCFLNSKQNKFRNNDKKKCENVANVSG